MDWPGTTSLSPLDKLLIECGVDEKLRKQMVADPADVLTKRGVAVPSGVTVAVVEDTMDTHTITLPPYVGADLSVDALQGSAASTWECTTCTPTSPICAGSLASLTCVNNKL